MFLRFQSPFKQAPYWLMWTCSNCSETVEADLSRCWSCGADQSGNVDPAFRRASEPLPSAAPAPPIQRYTLASLLLAATVVVGLAAVWRSSSLMTTILITAVIALCVLPVVFSIARNRETE
jgi:hypothetical protein